jgi:hypothetical protein
MREESPVRRVFGYALVLVVLCGSLCGCLVAGYSSGGRWWVWPGSLAITLLLMLVWLASRR